MSITMPIGGQTYHSCVEALQKATELRIVECAEVAEKHRRWLKETVLRTTRLLQSHSGDAEPSAATPQALPSVRRASAKAGMSSPDLSRREVEARTGTLTASNTVDDKENDAFAGNDATGDVQSRASETGPVVKAESNDKQDEDTKKAKAGRSSRSSAAKRKDVTIYVEDAKVGETLPAQPASEELPSGPMQQQPAVPETPVLTGRQRKRKGAAPSDEPLASKRANQGAPACNEELSAVTAPAVARVAAELMQTDAAPPVAATEDGAAGGMPAPADSPPKTQASEVAAALAGESAVCPMVGAAGRPKRAKAAAPKPPMASRSTRSVRTRAAGNPEATATNAVPCTAAAMSPSRTEAAATVEGPVAGIHADVALLGVATEEENLPSIATAQVPVQDTQVAPGEGKPTRGGRGRNRKPAGQVAVPLALQGGADGSSAGDLPAGDNEVATHVEVAAPTAAAPAPGSEDTQVAPVEVSPASACPSPAQHQDAATEGVVCVTGVHASTPCTNAHELAHVPLSATAARSVGWSPSPAASPALTMPGSAVEAEAPARGTGPKAARKGRRGATARVKAEVVEGGVTPAVTAATPTPSEGQVCMTDEGVGVGMLAVAAMSGGGHVTPRASASTPACAPLAMDAGHHATPAAGAGAELAADQPTLAALQNSRPAVPPLARRSLRSASRDSGASTVASSVETPRFAWAGASKHVASDTSPSLGMTSKEVASVPLVAVAAPVLPQSVPRSLRGRPSRGVPAASPVVAPSGSTPRAASSAVRAVMSSPASATIAVKMATPESIAQDTRAEVEVEEEPGMSLDDSMELDSANGDEGHARHDELVPEEGQGEGDGVMHHDVVGVHVGGGSSQEMHVDEVEDESAGTTRASKQWGQASPAVVVVTHPMQGAACQVLAATPLQVPLPPVALEAFVGRVTRSASRGALGVAAEAEMERARGSAVRGSVRGRASSTSQRQAEVLGYTSTPLASMLLGHKSPIGTPTAPAPVSPVATNQARASECVARKASWLCPPINEQQGGAREGKDSTGGLEGNRGGLELAWSPPASRAHVTGEKRVTGGSDRQPGLGATAMEPCDVGRASLVGPQEGEQPRRVLEASGADSALPARPTPTPAKVPVSPRMDVAEATEAAPRAAVDSAEEDNHHHGEEQATQAPHNDDVEMGAGRGSSSGDEVSDSEEGEEDGSEASLRGSTDGGNPPAAQAAVVPTGSSLRSNVVAAFRSFLPFVNKATAAPEPPAAGNRKNLRVPALERAAAAKAKEEARAARKRERAALLEQRKRGEGAGAGPAGAGASVAAPDPHDKPKEAPATAPTAAVLPVSKKGLAGPSAVELKIKRAVEARSRLEEEERRKAEEEMRRKEEEWQKKKAEAEAKRKAKEEADRREAEERRRRAEDVKAARRAEEDARRAEMEAREDERRKKAAAAEEEARRLKAKRDAAEAHHGAGAAAGKRKPEAVPAVAEVSQLPKLKKNKEAGQATCAQSSSSHPEEEGAGAKPSALSPEGSKERVIIIDPPPAPSRVPGAHSNPMMPPPPAKPVTSPPVSSPSVRKEGADVAAGAAVPCALQDAGVLSSAMGAGASTSAPAAELVESYVISPYKEDSDSDSDDEGAEPKKVYPLWARTTALWPALQAQERVDPDNIFKAPETCQLEEVFDKCHYNRKEKFRNRGSSGNWFGDHLRWQDELAYKKAMGYV
eukprot:jgi/Mesvir1/15989/Mv08294-RA.1